MTAQFSSWTPPGRFPVLLFWEVPETMSKLGFFLVCLFALAAGQANAQITHAATLPVQTDFVLSGVGGNPYSSIAWNKERDELYVPYKNSIQVFDTSDPNPANWHQKSPVWMQYPVFNLAMSKDGLVAVANQGSGSVTLFDPANGWSARTPPVDDNSFGMAVAFSPDGTTLYAAVIRKDFQAKIFSLDSQTLKVKQSWLVNDGNMGHIMVSNGVLNLLATNNGNLYGLGGRVTNFTPSLITEIYSVVVYKPDGSQEVVDTQSMLFPGEEPQTLSVGPDGDTLYVTGLIPYKGSLTFPSIVVIDSATNQMVRAVRNEMPSFLSWPSADESYAYGAWLNALDGINLTETQGNGNATVQRLGFPQECGGLVSRRLGDGSDQIIVLSQGEIDVYSATQPPLIYSVVNGASFQAVTLAPGENITIFGSALGYVGQADSTGLQILTTMGNTSASLDGRLLRLNYVSPGQINAYMPQNIGTGTHSLSVNVGTTTTLSQQVTVVDQNPALFTFIPDPVRAPGVTFPILMDGGYHILGDPTITNPEGQPFGYAQVNRGDVAIAWGTGGGITVPPISDSDVSPVGLHPLVITPPMTACGAPVALQYSGRGPGFPALDQYNFVVPAVCQSGANDMTLGSMPYKGALWVK